MRPAIFFFLVALFVSACERSNSFSAPPCPHDLHNDRMPAFQIVLSTVPTVIRRDLDINDISNLGGTESIGPHGRLQGLMSVEDRQRTRTEITVARNFLGGASCAWIKTLSIDITPPKFEIFIPREYPENSCEYEQILLHEKQHEQTAREMLFEEKEKLRSAFEKADWLPARGTPLSVSDRAEADKRIIKMVDNISAPVYEDIKRRFTDRQHVIDLPENYRWVSQRCRGWK